MQRPAALPLTPLGALIWRTKYQLHRDGLAIDTSIEDTWWRVAQALAAPEGASRDHWTRRFYGLLDGFRFLPGGRILAGAGGGKAVTLFNCFALGSVPDSMQGICDTLAASALTLQSGGGIGIDFSSLRPAGEAATASGGTATGPVSFMHVFDRLCATLSERHARRGAMMATLRCDHPDIETFIKAKRNAGALTHFNCSVLVTDAFMQAVAQDAAWPLVFPLDRGDAADTVRREWLGKTQPCRVHRSMRARALWQAIARAAYDTAEPGVLFIDRIQRDNPLSYAEYLPCTNPCGEVPLPAFGACDLGSFNLTAFVEHPFGTGARFDFAALESLVPDAVRLLDNVYDVSRFPMEIEASVSRASRRVGLGITGLADTLAMLNLDYRDEPARAWSAGLMRRIREAAWRASIGLAREKGAFAQFDAARFANHPRVASLPVDMRDDIARWGVRNSHLTAIAPTGSISLLAGNVSSGIEPIFALDYVRRMRSANGALETRHVSDFAYALLTAKRARDSLPSSLVTLDSVSPQAQLAMQAALQPHVDNAISKTVSVSRDCTFTEFATLFQDAWQFDLKGVAAYRPTPLRGAVIADLDMCKATDACESVT